MTTLTFTNCLMHHRYHSYPIGLILCALHYWFNDL